MEVDVLDDRDVVVEGVMLLDVDIELLINIEALIEGLKLYPVVHCDVNVGDEYVLGQLMVAQ
jgi:hypothetical protein